MAAGHAEACGPFFPNQVIAGNGNALLDIPNGEFDSELRALRTPIKTPAQSSPKAPLAPAPLADYRTGPSGRSAKADLEELAQVLAQNQRSGQTNGSAADLELYKKARVEITRHVDGVTPWAKKQDDILTAVELPAGLPVEFELYLKGLFAYNQNDQAAARKCWTDLLALPALDRKHRSTWAAFMLGKSHIAQNPARAIEYFMMTRKLAATGFTDTLDLSYESLGWQAKVQLDGNHVIQAVHLYLQQGDSWTRCDDYSLRECAKHVFAAGPEMITAAARDADCRGIVTAYLICDAGPYQTLSTAEKANIPAWLAAVESAAITDMPGADRLAWLAYSSGDFPAAARWIARSPRDSAVAGWVQSKLLLRDGKLDHAAKELVRVVRSFPRTELADYATPIQFNVDDPTQSVAQHIATDLGILQLTRGQYADSMRLLMMADHWRDAAYIAERVLTLDELQAFVDRFCPESKTLEGKTEDRSEGAKAPAWQESARELRLLLARRLTREGQWKVARAYFTSDLRLKLDQYIDGIRAGSDKTQNDDVRAAGYWAAAQCANRFGIDLLGTELGPDYHWYHGAFTFDDEAARLTTKGLSAPTPDELARYNQTEPEDARRYHYRYIAADYAWDAAQLMPDDSAGTAKVLYEAGSWLKAKEPQLADKYYKALVRRCPNTHLGKQAAELHWFPPAQEAASRE